MRPGLSGEAEPVHGVLSARRGRRGGEMSITATSTVHPQAIFVSSQVSQGAAVVHRLVHNRWRTSSTATRHAVPTLSPGASTGGQGAPLTGPVRPPNVPSTRPPVPRPRSQGEGERCWSPGGSVSSRALCRLGPRAVRGSVPFGAPCRSGLRAVRGSVPSRAPCRSGLRAVEGSVPSRAPCRPGPRAVQGPVPSRGSAAPLCTIVGHLPHRGLSPPTHAAATSPRLGRRGVPGTESATRRGRSGATPCGMSGTSFGYPLWTQKYYPQVLLVGGTVGCAG